MIRFFIFAISLSLALNAQVESTLDNNIKENYEELPKVDCLILKDENSIICKFEALRTIDDQKIIVQWLDPQGDVSRSREMIVPAGHGSIYDYRYIKGRLLGSWTFKVLLNDKEYKTEFELKEN